MKNTDITIIRGDTTEIGFTVAYEDGSPYTLTAEDKLYFTVKKNWYTEQFVVQKTIGNGIEFNEYTGEYVVTLTDLCTCGMECRDYVYDIESIINYNGKPITTTLAKGKLVLDTEATYRSNE